MIVNLEPVWTGDAHGNDRGYLSPVARACAHEPRQPPKPPPTAREWRAACRDAKGDGDRAQVGRVMAAYFKAHPGCELAAHEITVLVPHVPKPSLSSALTYLASRGVFRRRQTWRQVTGGRNRLVWVYREAA